MLVVRRFVALIGVFVMLTLVSACGGGSSATASGATAPLPKLSADEQQYADLIMGATSRDMPLEHARCLGAKLVKSLGLKKAKELDLAQLTANPSTVRSEADAEKVYTALDACDGATLFVMRLDQKKAGLTDAQVISCAAVMDKAAVKTFFLASFEGKKGTDDDKTATALLNDTLAKCKK